MKTEEDEAFDELARKQGDWGGGFKAKQGMAMHKTQDQNICRHYKQWQHCHICDLESQVEELKAKRTWVGLTDEEIDEGNKQSWVTKQAWESAVWWASEKLKEKNT